MKCLHKDAYFAGHAAPLADMPCGSVLLVESVDGSPELRSKLYSLGILPGTEMKVFRHGCDRGCLCVRVRHSSLVLSEEMARAVVCRPADCERRRHHPHVLFGGGRCRAHQAHHGHHARHDGQTEGRVDQGTHACVPTLFGSRPVGRG